MSEPTDEELDRLAEILEGVGVVEPEKAFGDYEHCDACHEQPCWDPGHIGCPGCQQWMVATGQIPGPEE